MNAPLRGLFSPIAKIEAVDPRTVKFTLSTPYSPLLSYLEMGIVPKKAVEAGGDLGAKPIGTGPMKLARWDRGSRIVLEAEPAILGRRSQGPGTAARRHRRQYGPRAGLRGEGSGPDPVAAVAPGYPAPAGQQHLRARDHVGARHHLPELQHRRSGGRGSEGSPGDRDAGRPEDHRGRPLSGRRSGRDVRSSCPHRGPTRRT